MKKAELDLDKLNSGADKAAGALNRMVAEFSGQKLIQQAQTATEAIDRIGGVTKLTQVEQAKLNAQVTEAIAKYDALGKEAPADMLRIQKETQGAANALKAVPAATDNILSGLSKMGAALGIGFSVGAVINFGKSVFDAASQIHDLSEQLGISSEAVQGFKFAAEQSGSSLDAVASAITKMNQHLSAGDDSTVAALKAAGLSFQNIRNLSPEDAFLAIADAIQKVPDPMKQSELAITLFGKSAAELLPAIKEGFRGVSDGASKMSEETIKSLEAAQDAWTHLGNQVVIVSGNMIGALTRAGNALTSSFSTFGHFVSESFRVGAASAAAMAIVEAEAKKLPDAMNPAARSIGETTEEQKKAAKAANDHAQAVQNLADKFSGASSIRDAKLAIEAINKNLRDGVTLWEMDDKSIAGVNQTLGLALDAYQRFGKVAPEAIRLTFIETSRLEPAVAGLVGAFENVGIKLEKEVIPPIADFGYTLNYVAGIPFGAKIGQQVDLVPPKVKVVTATLGDMSQALAQLSQISGSTFGGIASGLSTLVGAANSARIAINLMKDAGKQESKLDGILNMATGITGIVSAAIAAGKAIVSLFGLFDRNKGRDLVVNFAESFGGFDALHVKLLELGADGEALWVKLTQGVGRNNPQQAQRVIDEVTQALDEQAQKQAEAKDVTEEQAQATIETATEAAKALEELGPKLEDSKQQWRDWGAAVTGVLQMIADQTRALPIASPGGSLPFSAGSSGSTKVELSAPVYLDGKQIAESVAYHTLN